MDRDSKKPEMERKHTKYEAKDKNVLRTEGKAGSVGEGRSTGQSEMYSTGQSAMLADQDGF